MRDVDIMRTSASRPDYLRISTESMVKFLKPTVNFRWMVHEDQIDGGRSDECIRYAKESGVYSVIERHNPPIGQGASLGWLLGKCKTPYVLNWEDDQDPIKEIDIESLCNLMDNNPDINQIGFHKRTIMHEKPGFVKKQVVRDGVPLVTDPHWAFTPALWRASYIKPFWKSFDKNIHWRMNDILKGDLVRGPEWVMENTGTYFLGYGLCCLKEFGGNKTREEYMQLNNGYYMKHLGRQKHGEGGSVRLNGYKPGKVYWNPPRNDDFMIDMWRVT